MADSISENQIQKDVNDILKGADLSQLSSKKIRKQLEEKYDVDLSGRKKEIDTIVLEGIEAIENAEEQQENKSTANNEEDDDDDDNDVSSSSDLDAPEDMSPPVKKQKTKKKEASSDEDDEKPKDDAAMALQLQEEENSVGRRTRGGRKPPSKKPEKKARKLNADGTKKSSGTYGKECLLSPALASVMGAEKMKRSDVVKRMWEVVKERELQDPKNKSFMICDDELYKVFGRKRVKTFGMMKYLTDHIFTPEEYSTYFGVDAH